MKERRERKGGELDWGEYDVFERNCLYKTQDQVQWIHVSKKQFKCKNQITHRDATLY